MVIGVIPLVLALYNWGGILIYNKATRKPIAIFLLWIE
jgi:hypothetical protein